MSLGLPFDEIYGSIKQSDGFKFMSEFVEKLK